MTNLAIKTGGRHREIVGQGCPTYEKADWAVLRSVIRVDQPNPLNPRSIRCLSESVLRCDLIQPFHAGVQARQRGAELVHALLQEINRSLVHALLQQGSGLVE